MEGSGLREIEACVERWEKDVEMLRQWAYTERSAYAAEAARHADGGHGEMQLGLCAVAEKDEVFEALRENGRVVAAAPRAVWPVVIDAANRKVTNSTASRRLQAGAARD